MKPLAIEAVYDTKIEKQHYAEINNSKTWTIEVSDELLQLINSITADKYDTKQATACIYECRDSVIQIDKKFSMPPKSGSKIGYLKGTFNNSFNFCISQNQRFICFKSGEIYDLLEQRVVKKLSDIINCAFSQCGKMMAVIFKLTTNKQLVFYSTHNWKVLFNASSPINDSMLGYLKLIQLNNNINIYINYKYSSYEHYVNSLRVKTDQFISDNFNVKIELEGFESNKYIEYAKKARVLIGDNISITPKEDSAEFWYEFTKYLRSNASKEQLQNLEKNWQFDVLHYQVSPDYLEKDIDSGRITARRIRKDHKIISQECEFINELKDIQKTVVQLQQNLQQVQLEVSFDFESDGIDSAMENCKGFEEKQKIILNAESLLQQDLKKAEKSLKQCTAMLAFAKRSVQPLVSKLDEVLLEFKKTQQHAQVKSNYAEAFDIDLASKVEENLKKLNQSLDAISKLTFFNFNDGDNDEVRRFYSIIYELCEQVNYTYVDIDAIYLKEYEQARSAQEFLEDVQNAMKQKERSLLLLQEKYTTLAQVAQTDVEAVKDGILKYKSQIKDIKEEIIELEFKTQLGKYASQKPQIIKDIAAKKQQIKAITRAKEYKMLIQQRSWVVKHFPELASKMTVIEWDAYTASKDDQNECIERFDISDFEIVREINPRVSVYKYLHTDDDAVGKQVVLKKFDVDQADMIKSCLYVSNQFQDNKYILRCSGICEDLENNCIWLKYPFYENGSLDDWCKSDAFSYGKLPQIFTQMALAVRSLHKSGMIHVDIKPQNFLIDANDNIVLIDFDYCIYQKMELNTPTVINSTNMKIPHTYGYLAPEVNNFSKLSPQSDVFALGRAFAHVFKRGSQEFKVEAVPKELFELISQMTLQDPNGRISIHNVLKSQYLSKGKACCVCYSSIQIGYAFACNTSDEHSICQECMNHYVSEKASQGDAENGVKCPYQGCSFTYDSDFLLAKCSHATRKIIVNSIVENMKSIVERETRAIQTRVFEDNKKRVDEYFALKQEALKNSVMAKVKFLAYLENERAMMNGSCKLCPACGRIIFKAGGCDAMRCGTEGEAIYNPNQAVRSGCGARFQWTQARNYVSMETNIDAKINELEKEIRGMRQ